MKENSEFHFRNTESKVVEKHVNENTELVLGNAGQGLGRDQRERLNWGVRQGVATLGVRCLGKKIWTKKEQGSEDLTLGKC